MTRRGGGHSATTAGRGWAAGVLRAAGLRGSSRPGRVKDTLDDLIANAPADTHVANWNASTQRRQMRVSPEVAQRLEQAGLARILERP